MLTDLRQVHNNTPYNPQLTFLPRGLRKRRVCRVPSLLAGGTPADHR